jgi:thiosulfate/3-mercaptopyruvate sulfurtransferase
MATSHGAPGVLVTTDWAVEHLHDPGLRFVEVDVDTSAYDQGHLPGAVGFNWQTQLNAPIRRDIPSRADFEALLSSAGIGEDTTVVLYGDNNNWFAAFAFWLFAYYGHDRLALIDGGRKKLLAQRREFTTEVPAYPPTAYRVSTVRQELRARLGDVLRIAERGGTALVDVRSPAEFSGEVIAPPGMSETAQRGGHIPGAVNVPWSKAVREDGTFLPHDDLLRLYGGEGVDPAVSTVTYCRIGERSSHTWFVLKHLLGFSDVRNYDGSWTEYGNAIGVPIERRAPAAV